MRSAAVFHHHETSEAPTLSTNNAGCNPRPRYYSYPPPCQVVPTTNLWMTDVPSQLSVQQIAEQAGSRSMGDYPFDVSVPIDFTRPFLCPSLTALYYTPAWKELDDQERLRYTQLSALSFNELIAWFENGFSSTLQALMRSDSLPERLKSLLPDFMEDERRHQEIWWALNRCADPLRYSRGRAVISKVAPLGQTLMRWLATHPLKYPVAIWIMLILEEHGNEIARRCAAKRPDQIEPHFAAAYLAHVRDEVRHVQIDWHLLEWAWPTLRGWRRYVNVRIFLSVVNRLLFNTEHAAISVVEELVREKPRLRPLLPRIRAELREVGRNPEFRSMMFSARTSPIVFHLLDRFPELQAIVA